jgi:C_GCAxxG_C_C family probable redox protein
MTRQEQAKQIALERFAQYFNCAEATLLGLVEAYKLENACVPRIATGFGAGIGAYGEVCGALSGAVMALGLRFGREDAEDQDKKKALYEKVKTLFAEFEQEFGAIRCLELTGCDMRNPEGMQKAKDLKLHSDFCPKFVAWAAEKTAEILNRG